VTYFIAVTALDTSGNESGYSQEISKNIPVTDSQSPEIAITSPISEGTFTTQLATVDIAGTANDDQAVQEIIWASSSGNSGTASGINEWTINGISLTEGQNTITVTATDTNNNTASTSIVVTFNPYQLVWSPNDRSNPTDLQNATISGDGYIFLTPETSVVQVDYSIDGQLHNTERYAPYDIGEPVHTADMSDAAHVITTRVTLENGGVIDFDTSYSVSNIQLPPTDTTVPEISITAPSSNDFFTAQSTTINLAGTASDNDSLQQITWSSSTGANGVASGTTNWSVPGIILAEGQNVITVTATDFGGNQATDTITVAYTAPDTQAPEVSITTPSTPPGESYQTTSNTLQLYGTAQDDRGVAKVIWSSGNTGGTADGANNWEIPAVSLNEGFNTITVTALDEAGNQGSTSILINYTAPDTTAPVVIITSPVTAETYTSTETSINLAGTANDDKSLQQITWQSSTGSKGVASGTTSWSIYGINLAEGHNVITVTATDASGNQASDTITVSYTAPDTTAPVVTITSPVTAETYTSTGTSITLAGTASDNDSLKQITWSSSNGTTGFASGTASWSISGIDLAEGQNVITVTATDASGNKASDAIAISYAALDTQAPVIAITAPTDTGTFTTDASQVSLSGTADDDQSLKEVSWSSATGAGGIASGTSSWSISGINLAKGTNTITVTAVDSFGNKSADVLTVTYNAADTTKPTVQITSPTTKKSYFSRTSTVSIGGNASDDVGVAKVTWRNSRGESGTCAGTDNWQASSIKLDRWWNTITVTAIDGAGNTNEHSLVVFRWK